MTFQINGNTGKYDGVIKDDTIRYSKNAVDNLSTYMQKPMINENFATPPILDFSPNPEVQDVNIELMEDYIKENDDYLKSLPPLEFEYRYVPNLTNKSLRAAANAEMGGRESMPVEEFENLYLMNDEMTATPLDINKDGKIDNSEYAANILATDILSKGVTDVTKADGTINSKGMNAILEYTKKANSAAATKLYSSIYNAYNLGTI